MPLEVRVESNPRIRLIAVDLDGTLLTSKGVMAAEGARLLNKAAGNGIHVVLVTGRVIDSVRNLCGSLEISSPVVCTDGAQVYESLNGRALASLTFPKEIGLEITRLADANGWELATTVGPITYLRQRPGQALGEFAPYRVVVPTNSDAVCDSPMRILTQDSKAIDGIRSLCESQFSGHCRVQIYHGKDGNINQLGVFAPKVSKGNALASVLRRLKVRQSEVMAIGDDVNDLPMFSRSRIRVAMSNAHEQVKKEATIVAPSNDEEGVAWALTRFRIVPRDSQEAQRPITLGFYYREISSSSVRCLKLPFLEFD